MTTDWALSSRARSFDLGDLATSIEFIYDIGGDGGALFAADSNPSRRPLLALLRVQLCPSCLADRRNWARRVSSRLAELDGRGPHTSAVFATLQGTQFVVASLMTRPETAQRLARALRALPGEDAPQSLSLELGHRCSPGSPPYEALEALPASAALASPRLDIRVAPGCQDAVQRLARSCFSDQGTATGGAWRLDARGVSLSVAWDARGRRSVPARDFVERLQRRFHPRAVPHVVDLRVAFGDVASAEGPTADPGQGETWLPPSPRFASALQATGSGDHLLSALRAAHHACRRPDPLLADLRTHLRWLHDYHERQTRAAAERPSALTELASGTSAHLEALHTALGQRRVSAPSAQGHAAAGHLDPGVEQVLLGLWALQSLLAEATLSPPSGEAMGPTPGFWVLRPRYGLALPEPDGCVGVSALALEEALQLEHALPLLACQMADAVSGLIEPSPADEAAELYLGAWEMWELYEVREFIRALLDAHFADVLAAGICEGRWRPLAAHLVAVTDASPRRSRAFVACRAWLLHAAGTAWDTAALHTARLGAADPLLAACSGSHGVEVEMWPEARGPAESEIDPTAFARRLLSDREWQETWRQARRQTRAQFTDWAEARLPSRAGALIEAALDEAHRWARVAEPVVMAGAEYVCHRALGLARKWLESTSGFARVASPTPAQRARRLVRRVLYAADDEQAAPEGAAGKSRIELIDGLWGLALERARDAWLSPGAAATGSPSRPRPAPYQSSQSSSEARCRNSARRRSAGTAFCGTSCGAARPRRRRA